MIKSSFKKIKYYYTCLLFSFQYLSKISQFNTDQDYVVYRSSKFSEEEFQALKPKRIPTLFEFLKNSFQLVLTLKKQKIC